MQTLVESTPQIVAMIALLVVSGYFSGSEAALFYLSREQRDRLAKGGSAGRAAAGLLEDPPRLLSTLLFWNLAANTGFFALASLVGLQLQQAWGGQSANVVALLALFAAILFGEILPKNLAVLWPERASVLVALPLAAVARAVDPLMPALRMVTDASMRLLAPSFEEEPYLELGDLERAIELGSSDRELLEQERDVLSRTVSLSEVRLEEIMRPRKRYWAYPPPVHVDNLRGADPASGYVLITEPDTDEVALAMPLEQVAMTPIDALHLYAQPVAYMPWSAPAASALAELETTGKRVVAVLNELGETIGVLTLEDLFDHVLNPESIEHEAARRAERIIALGDGAWRATGGVTLRAVGRRLGSKLPETQSVTVAGLLQDLLQRVPETGDHVDWAGYRWTAREAPNRGPLVVELSPLDSEGPQAEGVAE